MDSLPEIDLSKWFVVRLSVTPITRLSRATSSMVYEFTHSAREYGIPKEALAKLERLRVNAYKMREKWTIPIRLAEEQLGADFLCATEDIPIILYKLEKLKEDYYKEMETIEKAAKDALPQLDKLIRDHDEQADYLKERAEEAANRGEVETAKNLNESAESEARLAEKMAEVKGLIDYGKFSDFFTFSYTIIPYSFHANPIKQLLEKDTAEQIERIVEVETQRTRKTREDAEYDRDREVERIRDDLRRISENVQNRIENEGRLTILQMRTVLYDRLKSVLDTIVRNVREGTPIRSDSLESIIDAFQPIKRLGTSLNDRDFNRLMAEAESQVANLREKKQLEEEMKAQPMEEKMSRIALLEEETKKRVTELGEALEEKAKELANIKSRWEIT